MARKKKKKKGKEEDEGEGRLEGFFSYLHPETKQSIWAVVFLGVSVVLLLARFGYAGPAGEWLSVIVTALLGIGYFVIPLILIALAVLLLIRRAQPIVGATSLGAALSILAFLGFADLFAEGQGGLIGRGVGTLETPFGITAAMIILLILAIIGVLIALNVPLRFPERTAREDSEEEEEVVAEEDLPAEDEYKEEVLTGEEETPEEKPSPRGIPAIRRGRRKPPRQTFENYTPPPLKLLASSTERPTTGDLRANANIIKRTLESFGIAVEMGEVNIGPKVTRYTLKPAEGVKLSRITALNQDLSLALAAHPIRIEAPIPGKSLVGIEVPNKAAALVRLGSLMLYPDFQTAGLLGFALGRDVTGEPIFVDIAAMPHLLIAGATGSGKSISLHSALISLLYKNSPETLRLILIDPKRVELSVYEGLPHLVSSVVTENKKALGVFRWAISEMERRYDLLLTAGSRDIESYNKRNGDEPLPYLVIVVDELADLMNTYRREVEGAVVRLAQMSRATGLHLILSTQRPSVEVITGLIKANITSRIALQVASQVDSRTILDTAGAEKLLGGGDLLFISASVSKPKRIQGAYVSEEEVKKVTDFIREHNIPVPADEEEDEADFEGRTSSFDSDTFEEYAKGNGGGDEDDDEMYDEAIRVIAEAKRASASFLQRRLKVGYARAARLLDMMEEHGLIGPGEGAKPREIFPEQFPRELRRGDEE